MLERLLERISVSEYKWKFILKDIFKEELIGTFCKCVEDDYYEWLKDNFKSFFNYGKPNWKWVRERIKKCGR